MARPIRLSIIDVLSMAVSIVVLLGFAWWLQRTRIARRRGRSRTTPAGRRERIDVDRVVRIVWIVAAALAGLSGILWAYFRPGIKWDMGTSILLLIFAAVVLGGLGTAYGALLGSLIVGLIVELSSLGARGPQVRRRARRAHRDPAAAATGILGRRERIG